MNEEELRRQLYDLDSKIDTAKTRLHRARLEIKLLRDQRRDTKNKLVRLAYNTYRHRSGMHDTHFAKADKLANAIKIWLIEQETTIRSLSEQCGVSAKTIGEILNSRREWVTLSTADMLLTTIDQIGLLEDLEIKENLRGYARMHPAPKSQYYEE